jgi:hypothetical protein
VIKTPDEVKSIAANFIVNDIVNLPKEFIEKVMD